MTIQEGDKQAAQAHARFVIARFIQECAKYPAYTEQMGALMQQVCDDRFNEAQPRPWVEQVGNRR